MISAENFRKKINNKSTVSNGLLESISLGTGNYAPFYEAGNIYAKYYSADNIPSEDVLISNLNDFLELYNQLVNNNSQIGIRDFIKTVLEKYLDAKDDEKLAKELITKYANKNDFQKYLAKIANQTIKGNLDTYGYFRAATGLNLLPRVDIFDINRSPFFIRFSFREDMKGVYLSLTDSYRRYEKIMKDKGIIFEKFDEKYQDYIKRTVNDVRNKLNQLTIIQEGFTENIDLHSKKAASASSAEAANIYANIILWIIYHQKKH